MPSSNPPPPEPGQPRCYAWLRRLLLTRWLLLCFGTVSAMLLGTMILESMCNGCRASPGASLGFLIGEGFGLIFLISGAVMAVAGTGVYHPNNGWKDDPDIAARLPTSHWRFISVGRKGPT